MRENVVKFYYELCDKGTIIAIIIFCAVCVTLELLDSYIRKIKKINCPSAYGAYSFLVVRELTLHLLFVFSLQEGFQLQDFPLSLVISIAISGFCSIIVHRIVYGKWYGDILMKIHLIDLIAKTKSN